MQRLPRAPKAVLFDMDGLMLDTEALYRDATITAARNAGFELPLPAYLETIGLPASSVREVLLARFGKDAPLEDLWRQASELFTQMVQTDLRTKAGLPEILSFLEEARIPSAIVTSSDRTAVEGPSFRNRPARPVPNHCCLWRLQGGKTASRSIPAGRRAAQPAHFRMRCPGRLQKWGSLRIRRRSDDHHGAGSGSAGSRSSWSLRLRLGGSSRRSGLDRNLEWARVGGIEAGETEQEIVNFLPVA
ncbi:HAD family hydrolase [Rhizobium leguminosarum]|uniref:HAD family hydrolase n=1 Tax=Rhizobium leguminosarum TaxID=384 RepID=UPI003D7A88DF